MPAALDDVAPDIALPEPRGNDGRSPERKVDLSTMRVARERHRDAVRDLGEEVGVVREGDCADAFRQAVEDGADVRPRLQYVTDPDEPEVEAFTLDVQALVLENANARDSKAALTRGASYQ